MRFQLSVPVVTIGWLLAIVILILAILGLVGVLPSTPVVVFGLIGGLAIARLL